MEYAFTLKFKLPHAEDNDEKIMLSLAEAGCTDALVGLGSAGHIGLEFIREAASAEVAILSAMEDVNKALPGATLIEAGPDFVGLTDVADLVGVSRQNMRKLMINNTADFPEPVHTGSSAIWHLTHLLDFLGKRQYGFAKSIADVAWAAMQINLTKQATLIDTEIERKVRQRLVA